MMKNYSDLSLLLHLSQILDKSVDIKNVIHPVLVSIAEYFHSPRGIIALLNRKSDQILIEEAYGLTFEEKKRGRYQVGEGIIGRVVETGLPRIIPSLSDEPEFLNKTESRDHHLPSIGFICVPITIGNEVIGTIAVDDPETKIKRQKEHMQTLSVTASLIAQAVKLRQRMVEEKEYLLKENSRLKKELELRYKPSRIIGNASSMTPIFDRLALACQENYSLLIQGEPGTGKDLLCHVIHYNSQRSRHSLVRILCSSSSETFIEKELFGISDSSPGKILDAHLGILYCSEIGSLPLHLQSQLASIIKNKSFSPSYSAESFHCNIRLIATSTQNIDDLQRKKLIDLDLLELIESHLITLPPLRKRKGDIPLLANYFIQLFCETNRTHIRRISTPAINLLINYHWPGNVSELAHTIEGAVLKSEDEVIHSHHLPPTLQSAESSS